MFIDTILTPSDTQGSSVLCKSTVDIPESTPVYCGSSLANFSGPDYPLTRASIVSSSRREASQVTLFVHRLLSALKHLLSIRLIALSIN